MSTWVAPATWVDGAVSAATMNAEIRDHALWLKGFADLITNSTAADTGTTTYLHIERSAGSVVFSAGVPGDPQTSRWVVDTNGAMYWGDGTAILDLELARDGAGRLVLGGGASPQLGVTQATGGVERNQIFTWISADTFPRVALGLTAGDQGRIAFGSGAAAPDFTIERNAAGRIVATSTASGGARIGVVSDANESSGHFSWRTGDTIPRVSIGQESSGLPALRFSPGSGGTYETIYRESTGIIATESTFKSTAGYFQSIRSAAASSYFIGNVTGDTGPRIRLSTTASGSGSIYFDDGTAAAGAEDAVLYRNGVGALKTNATFDTDGAFLFAGTQVVGSRKTGWVNATGTAARGTFVTSTVALNGAGSVAEHLKALIDDLMVHGLLGA
jgi:hypothetical protein